MRSSSCSRSIFCSFVKYFFGRSYFFEHSASWISCRCQILEAKGGNAGNPWDDGPHDGVKKVYVGQGESGVSYVKFVYEKDLRRSPEMIMEKGHYLHLKRLNI